MRLCSLWCPDVWLRGVWTWKCAGRRHFTVVCPFICFASKKILSLISPFSLTLSWRQPNDSTCRGFPLIMHELSLAVSAPCSCVSDEEKVFFVVSLFKLSSSSFLNALLKRSPKTPYHLVGWILSSEDLLHQAPCKKGRHFDRIYHQFATWVFYPSSSSFELLTNCWFLWCLLMCKAVSKLCFTFTHTSFSGVKIAPVHFSSSRTVPSQHL